MKKRNLFSRKDLHQIKNLGLSVVDVENQLKSYRRGIRYLNLNRHCAARDGISIISPAQRKNLIKLFESEAGRYQLVKFVPASGAASRMFNEWFVAREKGSFGSEILNQKFFLDLDLFAFATFLKKSKKGKMLRERNDVKELLGFILGKEGLNYGDKPKALIPFHRYPSGELHTALEEHLVEAAKYICSTGNICHIHFTLSREHKKEIIDYLQTIKAKYQNTYQVKFKINFSLQSDSTSTIAVNEKNYPARNAKGSLIFRPGGHGALLKNLNDLDADFIFVKNIDNVVPENLLEHNLPYKKMLGGLALKVSREIFAILQRIAAGRTSGAEVDQFAQYCSKTLNIFFPRGFARQTKAKKLRTIFSVLNRPLRICGVVKNEGEPGGGPFWVNERNGTQTLQIVERDHVDKNNQRQAVIWMQAKYFNPVDMVCCIKNYRGEKFRLADYVDRDAFLITTKNEKGMTLKVLEWPGLWNGGMAYWNTLFVNIPITAFNPVKTVDDLLRREHLTTG